MKHALLALLAACGPGPRTPGDIAHHPAAPPVQVDTDDDGVPDARDGCPDVAEDWDLFADGDGCPDLDDDHDGVADLEDACFDLPGTDGGGCPEGCTITTTIDDCFFITPIWRPAIPAAELAATRALFEEFPEIRTVTLTAGSADGEAPELAHQRAISAMRDLVTSGVPQAKLALDTKVMPGHPGGEVFGLITRQRFAAGKFRSSHCAGGMGTVYRVQREHNYSCHPVICGDGICYRGTEDDGACPKDCPP